MSLYCSFPECDRHAFINGLCYTHDKEQKREAKDKLKEKKIYKIPAKSKKKAKEDREYTVLRKKFLEEYPMCQASIHGYCTGKSTQVHHISKSQTNFLEVSTWLAVCQDCHNMIERYMTAVDRREKGLLKD